jgi:short-subunit dehydrogenase
MARMADASTGGTGRHILITGASSGIGAALARQHAEPGVLLTLMGRSRERLDDVSASCEARGAEARGVSIDVRDAAGLEKALLAADAAQAIDILIANAGIGGPRSLAGRHGEAPEAAREVAEVNFLGVVNTVSVLAPRFSQRGRGQIVIVSSLAAAAPVPLAPTYAGSKAGVSAYARSLRILMRDAGVRVTLVLPGFVETPMSRDLPGPKPGILPAEAAARIIAEGIRAGKAEIAFPWSLRLAAWAARRAPDALIAGIQNKWRRP